MEGSAVGVLYRDWLHPLGAVGGQVVGRHHPAVGAHGGSHASGDGAGVEGIGAVVGDCPQRGGELRVAEKLDRPRRAPARQPDAARIGQTGQQLRRALPGGGDTGADRIAVSGVGDGLGQQCVKPTRAEALQNQLPAAQCAGHSNGQAATGGKGCVAPTTYQVGRQPRRGRAAGVQAKQPPLGRRPDEGERVAADAGGTRLDDAQRGHGGDGGVDGVAAALQHSQSGLRRQRLARRYQPIARRHVGPTRWKGIIREVH